MIAGMEHSIHSEAAALCNRSQPKLRIKETVEGSTVAFSAKLHQHIYMDISTSICQRVKTKSKIQCILYNSFVAPTIFYHHFLILLTVDLFEVNVEIQN